MVVSIFVGRATELARFQALWESATLPGEQLVQGLADIYQVFSRLTQIIPVLLVADEIQEWYRATFAEGPGDHDPGETGLHDYTRLLKNLLDRPMLLVLSGTRYSILLVN